MPYLLKKEDFIRFIDLLIPLYNVVAPVKNIKRNRSEFKMLNIKEGNKLVFDLPLYPAKEVFLPKNEKLFEFDNGNIIDVKHDNKQTLLFMNRCDINAVHRNDLIMLDEPQDLNYKAKRDNAVLIEIPCRITERCVCTDMGLIDYYDLKIVEMYNEDNENPKGNSKKNNKGNYIKDSYILDVRTKKGEDLIEKIKKKLSLGKATYTKPKLNTFKLKQVKTDNKEVWEKYGKECLSCSACTIVCPTCMCFTIDDHLNLDLKSGNRHREWASCQLLNFTKVAGGNAFRKDRGARGKQRIHCKFIYFREKYKYPRCVGCGRCSAACPVGINIFEYFRSLK